MKKPVIIWIGISMQNGFNEAFPTSTPSGKILNDIFSFLPQFDHVTMNLVSFAPLDEFKKVRYPTKAEVYSSRFDLINDIRSNDPFLIVCLGKFVTKYLSDFYSFFPLYPNNFSYSLTSFGGLNFLSIPHPSYINIYRRKLINTYIMSVSEFVKNL